MGKQINEREIVLEILMEITENGAYSHKILGDVLSKYQYHQNLKDIIKL